MILIDMKDNNSVRKQSQTKFIHLSSPTTSNEGFCRTIVSVDGNE